MVRLATVSVVTARQLEENIISTVSAVTEGHLEKNDRHYGRR
jgi:hypothetical protein